MGHGNEVGKKGESWSLCEILYMEITECVKTAVEKHQVYR